MIDAVALDSLQIIHIFMKLLCPKIDIVFCEIDYFTCFTGYSLLLTLLCGGCLFCNSIVLVSGAACAALWSLHLYQQSCSMSSMCMDGYPYLRMNSMCSSLLNVDWYLRLKWIEKCVKTSTFMKISYMQRASSIYSLTLSVCSWLPFSKVTVHCRGGGGI